MGRLESFSADDEAADTLRHLGYSEEQIGATAGQLESSMGTEERLRLSLRALSAQHSESIQEKAEAAAPPANPKMFEKQERPVEGEDQGAYERGRRDERYLRRNDPNYVPPPRKPRARKPVDPARAAAAKSRKFGAMYKRMGGGGRRRR
jgi:hypothetical protein